MTAGETLRRGRHRIFILIWYLFRLKVADYSWICYFLYGVVTDQQHTAATIGDRIDRQGDDFMDKASRDGAAMQQ